MTQEHSLDYNQNISLHYLSDPNHHSVRDMTRYLAEMIKSARSVIAESGKNGLAVFDNLERIANDTCKLAKEHEERQECDVLKTQAILLQTAVSLSKWQARQVKRGLPSEQPLTPEWGMLDDMQKQCVSIRKRLGLNQYDCDDEGGVESTNRKEGIGPLGV